MSLPAAVSGLVIVTVITSFCADYCMSISAKLLRFAQAFGAVVDSIDEFADEYGIPKAFIG